MMHAGLEEGRLNLMVVENDENLRKILRKLDFEIRNDGRISENGNIQHCNCCGKEVSIKNFGNLMPGSLELYCDNPACLSDYVVKHRGY
jgi:hypothetical protein